MSRGLLSIAPLFPLHSQYLTILPSGAKSLAANNNYSPASRAVPAIEAILEIDQRDLKVTICASYRYPDRKPFN